MQKDLSRFKILGKFSILQFMALAGLSGLVWTLILDPLLSCC